MGKAKRVSALIVTPKKKTQRTKASLPKKQTQKTTNKTSRKTDNTANLIQSNSIMNDAEIDWTSIAILGERVDTRRISCMRNGSSHSVGDGTKNWDFSHLQALINSELKNHSDCCAYLFATSELIDFDMDKISDAHGVLGVPVVNIILIKSGQCPPELLSVRLPQLGEENVIPFRRLKFKWQSTSQSRVFILDCMLRNCSMMNKSDIFLFQYEYAMLYMMRPSIDWIENRHGKLDIKHVIFTYKSDDLEDSPVYEEFDKVYHRLGTFIPDFLERYDLSKSHYNAVETTIREAFDSARKERMKKKELFKHFDPDLLEDIKTVKIYPKNEFIGSHHKNNEINRYYGTATKVF